MTTMNQQGKDEQMTTLGQTITIDGLTVKVGDLTFEYDSIVVLTMQGKVYIEGYLDGGLEDRFLID